MPHRIAENNPRKVLSALALQAAYMGLYVPQTPRKPHIVWLRDGGHMQPVRERMPLWADGYTWIWRNSSGLLQWDNQFPRWDCPELCLGDSCLGVLFFENEETA